MISVIVPIYKCAKTISNCVNSLINQSYTNLEIILVDDGSPDDSGKIADELGQKDQRIKVLHQINQGVSAARNAGIKVASGKYIMFVDSDDYVDRDYCLLPLTYLEKYQCDYVVFGYQNIYENRCEKVLPSIVGLLEGNDIQDNYPKLYDSYVTNSPWNKLFKRELITELFDTNHSLGEDVLFNLQYLCQVDRMYVLQESLYNYVRDTNTLSRKVDQTFIKDLYQRYLKEEALLNKKFGKDNQITCFKKSYVSDMLTLLGYYIRTQKKKESLVVIQELLNDCFYMDLLKVTEVPGKRKKMIKKLLLNNKASFVYWFYWLLSKVGKIK